MEQFTSGELEFIQRKARDDSELQKICNLSYVSRILYEIARERPYDMDREKISQRAGLDREFVETRLNRLCLARVLEEGQEGGYRLCLPVMLQDEVSNFQKRVDRYAEKVVEFLIRHWTRILQGTRVCWEKDEKFSRERLLYHLLCQEIFGYVRERWRDNREAYQIKDNWFGYERCAFVAKERNCLLCHKQVVDSGKIRYCTFGDNAGVRKDVTLIKKELVDKGRESDFRKALSQADALIMELVTAKGIVKEREDKGMSYGMHLLLEAGCMKGFAEEGYVLKLPFFMDSDIMTIRSCEEWLVNELLERADRFFHEDVGGLLKDTAVERHEIKMTQTIEEIWCRMEGTVNGLLVKNGLIESPLYREQEGRYLGCLILR